MGVREIDRFLQQWHMDARDLHRRLILAPTPRERDVGTPSGYWPRAGRLQPRRMLWDGIPTPSDGGLPPSARAGLGP